jgi:putative nucleotidyltransferase with HDIG domain
MATTARVSNPLLKQLPIEESRHIVVSQTGTIGYPDDHAIAVAECSLRIAVRLGLDPDVRRTIAAGALLHDVGKLRVDDRILSKPGPLTPDERRNVEQHPLEGERILQDSVEPPVREVVLAHHERWDGDGYPRRLKGEDIPLGARIFALCDTYDAIISDRPYRLGQTADAAFTEIMRCAGTQFDPTVIEAFEASFPRWRGETPEGARKPLYLPAWVAGEGRETRAAG